MTGNKKMMITPFIPLTTLRTPETQENLIRVWKRLPTCTKLAFISFASAKVTLALAFCFMMMTMAKIAIGLGTFYAILVWTSIFLAVYDWLKHYMEEDPSLPNLFELDADETSL